MTTPETSLEEMRGWDPVVRVTHWGIAAAVLANGLLDEGGSTIHIWIGYAAAALLVLRLLWGLIGPREARFSSFPPSLSAARTHIMETIAGKRTRHVSHNPLGTLMVYAFWGTLLVIVATGIGMAGSPFSATQAPVVAGEASGYEIHEGHGEREHAGEEKEEGPLEVIHEVAGNLILILAALHLAGVGLESYLSGTNLARSMVTGKRA